MFNTNEYFDGNVISISFESEKGQATAGAMAPGEYTFNTSKGETMKITSGKMTVILPGKSEKKTFEESQSFTVPANSSFQVFLENDCTYICYYK